MSPAGSTCTAGVRRSQSASTSASRAGSVRWGKWPDCSKTSSVVPGTERASASPWETGMIASLRPHTTNSGRSAAR